MKYRVYPKGYDPMVASGPVTEDCVRLGVSWIEDDTKKALELEKQFVIEDSKPHPRRCRSSTKFFRFN
jgi:hypothetical protein